MNSTGDAPPGPREYQNRERKHDTPLWREVRKQRKQHKWLCDQTGIKFWRLQQLLTGSIPTPEEATALARILGVAETTLFVKEKQLVYRHRELHTERGNHDHDPQSEAAQAR